MSSTGENGVSDISGRLSAAGGNPKSLAGECVSDRISWEPLKTHAGFGFRRRKADCRGRQVKCAAVLGGDGGRIGGGRVVYPGLFLPGPSESGFVIILRDGRTREEPFEDWMGVGQGQCRADGNFVDNGWNVGSWVLFFAMGLRNPGTSCDMAEKVWMGCILLESLFLLRCSSWGVCSGAEIIASATSVVCDCRTDDARRCLWDRQRVDV